jgi:hypothetical protein
MLHGLHFSWLRTFRENMSVPCMISGFLFWDVTQRRLVVNYRRFGSIGFLLLSKAVKNILFFLDCLSLREGTAVLSSNVGNEPPIYDA